MMMMIIMIMMMMMIIMSLITASTIIISLNHPNTYLQSLSVMLTELVHLVHLLLPLFEPPEVILDEEGGIELSNGDVIVT